jgi:hypothetical protein
MKRELLITFVLTIICIATYGQLTLKQVKFHSWFGAEQNSNPEKSYCLLGTNFFRTPQAQNTDSLILAWSNQHANAQVIPVFESGPTFTDKPNSRLIYCWVMDGLDTLNLALVRHGCVPGSTMQRPKTWDEMDSKYKELLADNKRGFEKVYIENGVYFMFIDRVLKAEKEASRKRLGIWKEKKD